jgi:hypothetical protein
MTVTGTSRLRGRSPSLRLSLLLGLLVRVIVAAAADGRTPRDVAQYFRATGELVRAGRDPLTRLPQYQWNFTPWLPGLHALEQLTGLPWEVAEKVPVIGADLIVVALVSRLGGRWAAAAYALCPLAVWVSAWHGQAEPMLVAAALAALILAQRDRAVTAGLLLGLAIAAKSWPVLLAPAVLLAAARAGGRRSALTVAGAALAPIAAGIAGLLALHAPLGAALHRLAAYRSLAGRWSWAALLHQAGWVGFGYEGTGLDAVDRLGSVLTVLAFGVVAVVAWRRRPEPLLLAAAVPLAVLTVAPGFGIQYLTWPLAAVIALAGQRRLPAPAVRAFWLLASAWAVAFYLVVVPADAGSDPLWFALCGLPVWGCVAVLFAGTLTARKAA